MSNNGSLPDEFQNKGWAFRIILICYNYKPLVMTEFGPLANPRLCVFAEGEAVRYKWQVVFSGEYSATTVEPYLEQLKPVSGFKVCPGIKEYSKEIRFDTKNLRRWGISFDRIDDQSCLLWHVPNNTYHPTGDRLRDSCQPCRVLHYGVLKLAEKASSLTEAQKLAELQSSHRLPYFHCC